MPFGKFTFPFWKALLLPTSLRGMLLSPWLISNTATVSLFRTLVLKACMKLHPKWKSEGISLIIATLFFRKNQTGGGT